MVLIRLLGAALLLAGCKQSLFSNTTGGPHPDGPMIASSCPAPCVGDAGGNYDQTGWRYLEDHRDRTWVPMTASGDTQTGATAANTITSCAAHPAAACNTLPGALLVSSAGHSAPADPAIEFTSASNQVLTLELGAVVATGTDQVIRVYRNSREDTLFTGTATAGGTLTASVTLDALAGDRFLVAVAPDTTGAQDVGIQLFLSGAGASFPSTCQLALEFAPRDSTMVHDSCNTAAELSSLNSAVTPETPELVANLPPPYAELSALAGQIKMDQYFSAPAALDRHGDSTTQLWLKQTSFVNGTAGWFITDIDLDNGGGLGIDLGQNTGGNNIVEAYTGTAAGMVDGVNGGFPNDHGWHFVRATYASGTLKLCLDGKKIGEKAEPSLATTYPTFLGKNQNYVPVGAFVDGAVDDVRVLKGALPCD